MLVCGVEPRAQKEVETKTHSFVMNHFNQFDAFVYTNMLY